MARSQRSLVVLLAVALVTVGIGGVATASANHGSSAAVVDAAAVDAAHVDSSPVDFAPMDGAAIGGTAQTDCSYPVTVTDATGTEVTVEERPDRIVVLQPSDAQIVWAIGAENRVVGMPQGSTTAYLNGTEGITHVKNDDLSVDVEQVTNLSADVVIAANVTQTATVDQLRSTGTPVYHFGEVGSLDEIYENVNRTGAIVGNCEQAATAVTDMQTRIDRIERAVADGEDPSVLFFSYGYTTGENSHIHDLITTAGGENVAATAGVQGYREISQEIVVANDPEWIVVPTGGPGPSGAPYNDTTALAADQVLRVNTNYVNQPGPRVVHAIETMAQAFHPDAFGENGELIVPSPTPTAGSGDGSDVESTATSGNLSMNATDADVTGPTQTTEGDGPGFTPTIAIVALAVAAVALASRRKGV